MVTTTFISSQDLPVNEKEITKSEHLEPLNLPAETEYLQDPETTTTNSFLNSLHNFDVSISTPVFRFQGGTFLNLIAYCASAVFIEETFILVIILLHCIFGLHWIRTLQYFTVFLANIVVTIVAKNLFRRTRPSITEIENTTKAKFFRLKQRSNTSLPSGDTIQSVALFTYAVLFLPWPYVVGFAPLAVLNPISRVYLGCHFFGDITAGAVLSVITTSTVYVVLHLEPVLRAYLRLANYLDRTI